MQQNDPVKDEKIAKLIHDAKSTLTSIKAYGQILQRRFIRRDEKETMEDLMKMDEKIDALTAILTETHREVKAIYHDT